MTSSDVLGTGILTELFIREYEFDKHGDMNPEIPPVGNIQEYEFSRNEKGYLSFREKGHDG